MAEELIKVEDVSKHYRWGKVKAVENVSFSVHRGEHFGLIGPNGAGKTTLMGCMLALLKPSKGKILIDGKSPFDLDVKKQLGFLPERPHFDSWMTVGQFLWYHHMLAGRPEKDQRKDIKEALALVELEPEVEKRKVKELSRGMLQRLGLAQSIIGKPQLLFLDEATSGMDPLGMILVRKLLMKFKDDGITVILNSHHLAEVEKVCDRVAFIRKGKIEAIEDLKDAAGQKQTLILNWMENADEDGLGKLNSAIGELGCMLLENNESFARVSIADREQAMKLIKTLVESGVPLFEAKWERRSLVELFLDEKEKEKPKDVQ